MSKGGGGAAGQQIVQQGNQGDEKRSSSAWLVFAGAEPFIWSGVNLKLNGFMSHITLLQHKKGVEEETER